MNWNCRSCAQDFGKKTFRDISIHTITQQLGPRYSEALFFPHSFTRCDVTSSTFGIDKKTVWTAWAAFPEVTDTFISVTKYPANFLLDSLQTVRLVQLAVLMCSKNSQPACQWSQKIIVLLCPSKQLSMLCSSWWGDYLLQLSSGKSLSKNLMFHHARINGDGRGYNTGPIF